MAYFTFEIILTNVEEVCMIEAEFHIIILERLKIVDTTK